MNGEDVEPLAQAQAALAASRWSDAAQGFRAALEQGPDADALFGLGIASFWLGETHAALRCWQDAYVAYRRRPDLTQAAMSAVYLSLSYRMSVGNAAAARGWLGRAARLVDDHQLEELRGWVLLCRADVANDTGHPAAAEGWAREAIEMARSSGDLDLELCALSELGAALVELGRPEEGVAVSDEAMAGALAGEGLNLDAVVLISCRTITACSRAGDLARATQWVRAADEFYRRHGSPHLYTTCRTQYGAILFATGRWEDAERELTAALRIGEAAEPALHATALATMAEMRVAQGRLEDAYRLLAGFEDNPATALASAMAQLAGGRAAPAAAILRRRLRQLDEACLEAAAIQELLVAAEAELSQRARAARRAEALAERGSSSASDIVRARGERAVGRARAAQGKPTQAAEHFDRAIDAFAQAGMPVEVGRTRLLRARVLAEAEPDTAVMEAQRAMAAFEHVGATRDADAAAALLRQLGSRPARGGRAIGVLTKRELEVLSLLGEGLSNPQIGERLFITRKTVEHHVASVLAKIGLSGRAEAAAYATRELGSAVTVQK